MRAYQAIYSDFAAEFIISLVTRCFQREGVTSSVRSGMFIARPGHNTPPPFGAA